MNGGQVLPWLLIMIFDDPLSHDHVPLLILHSRLIRNGISSLFCFWNLFMNTNKLTWLLHTIIHTSNISRM